jgi:L-iditol 2-dehydrogenase
MAAVLKKPRNLETQHFPYPKDIPDDCMIVKMKMSGVCGSDKHVYNGMAPDMPFPIIPGHENIGIVHEIGNKARTSFEVHGETLQIGDRVTWYGGVACGQCWYCRWTYPIHGFCERGIAYGWNVTCKDPPHLFGGWSEYFYVRPGVQVHKIPDALPTDVAVLNDTMASVSGVERAMMPYPYIREGFGLGSSVVIQGSGPIGVMAAVRAKICGANKIVMIGAPKHRLELAKQFGVDETIDIEERPNADDRINEVKDIVGGLGADLVIEAAGAPKAVPEGIELVRKGGTYVIVGILFDMGSVQIKPHKLTSKCIHLLGQGDMPPIEYWKSLSILTHYRDAFPFARLVTHKMHIDEAEKALQASERLETMKAVIVPR